jgi:hypothetical protein
MDDERNEDAETTQEPVVPDPPPAVVEAAPAVAAIQSDEANAGRRGGLAAWFSGLLNRRR